MRISRIEALPIRIPLKPERRMISALGKHDVSEFTLVVVHTDDGLFGLGEATVTPRWSGETARGAQTLIEHVFTPVLLGCDPCDIEAIDARLDAVAVDNWFAKAAIEMACWDLAGKAANKPVYELLGGACRPLTIRNRFSLGAYTTEVIQPRAVALVAAGFDTLKVKVGTDPVADVVRVRAVREVIGPNIKLTIDANGGWNEAQALDCLAKLADCNLTLVEQPLPRGNYSGLKRLRERTGQKILADESCFDEVEARELIEQGCCDAISLYPGKQGGIRRSIRIANLAAEHQIPCSIGSNLEWDVGAAAMLHFIVATPNMQVELYPGDCLGPFYHEVSLAKNPLHISGPFTTINSGPGLGIELDFDVVEKHRIR
ncbi:L-Ala-D/L-Glu epimerase [Anatilimnocola aggregata]|uniref:L-Ala-D/L-Glu epimerase n=1 Tax=Anatilimnocola aggregata TaxID=2528021 RepID=A0A517YBW4_9BACT|nr:enolase C-terminal domain-like protein [Anatilimnocola aggregata]QDU27714.1 L-Ala-D/L-Glu epimerase [Anatilimnocola aggregata]